MANREACELYIEQDIKESLEQGETPYSIAKRLVKMIEKLFKVYLPRKTLESRARRLKEKNTPNGVKNSEVTNNPDTYKLIDPGRGGKRDGAGRPKLKPAVTKEQEKLAGEFTGPISYISRCTFTADCIVELMEPWQMEEFIKAYELIKQIKEVLSNEKSLLRKEVIR